MKLIYLLFLVFSMQSFFATSQIKEPASNANYYSLVNLDVRTSDLLFANEVYPLQMENPKMSPESSGSGGAINILQRGNNNFFQVTGQTSMLHENVIQIGNYNAMFDHATGPAKPTSFSTIQQGNQNHIEKFGSNSISNGMIIHIKGHNAAVIVRNFN